VLNSLPRPQSRNCSLRTAFPLELATGSKPDLSLRIAAPGQLVVVHNDGARASACAPTCSLAYYMRPSGGGPWCVTCVRGAPSSPIMSAPVVGSSGADCLSTGDSRWLRSVPARITCGGWPLKGRGGGRA
jgi:hypothetical protein